MSKFLPVFYIFLAGGSLYLANAFMHTTPTHHDIPYQDEQKPYLAWIPTPYDHYKCSLNNASEHTPSCETLKNPIIGGIYNFSNIHDVSLPGAVLPKNNTLTFNTFSNHCDNIKLSISSHCSILLSLDPTQFTDPALYHADITYTALKTPWSLDIDVLP